MTNDLNDLRDHFQKKSHLKIRRPQWEHCTALHLTGLTGGSRVLTL